MSRRPICSRHSRPSGRGRPPAAGLAVHRSLPAHVRSRTIPALLAAGEAAAPPSGAGTPVADLCRPSGTGRSRPSRSLNAHRHRPRRPGGDRAAERPGDGGRLRRRRRGATTAPLNPAYRDEEFEFYLTDLKAKAWWSSRACESPARAVAAARSACRWSSWSPAEATAGDSRLRAAARAARRPPGRAGRAGRRGAGAAHLRHHLAAEDRAADPHQPHRLRPQHRPHPRLTPDDACLNVMPLFHIHGLIAAVLASLAGRRRRCAARRASTRCSFFGWLDEVQPTWYTAVPTMHQAILARAARNAEIIARAPRCASSARPRPRCRRR